MGGHASPRSTPTTTNPQTVRYVGVEWEANEAAEFSTFAGALREGPSRSARRFSGPRNEPRNERGWARGRPCRLAACTVRRWTRDS